MTIPPITPESRARAIVTAWDEGDYAGKSCGELDAIIERDIAQAIREAENAAYERVAAVCDAYDWYSAGMPKGSAAEAVHQVSDDIAKLARCFIRHKETP